jgi:hypothetical protein
MKNLLMTLAMLLCLGTMSAQQTNPKTTKKAKTSADTIMNNRTTTTKSSTYKTDTVKKKHPTTKKKSSTKTKTAKDSLNRYPRKGTDTINGSMRTPN